jgi:hypothetical protein
MSKTMNTTDELLKIAREVVLKNAIDVSEEVKVRCFFDELKYRQKRKVKKTSTNHYQDWLYYIAYDGRLARVINTAKNPQGMRLLKQKTIEKDGYGLLRADEEITIGQYVKTRPLLKELDPYDKWDYDVKEEIARYLDGGHECTMIIDRNFEIAYEPDYDDDFCIDGDLVTGQSCMSGQGEYAQEFYGGIHGCYVCRFENKEGEQVGRCIMYEYEGVRHFIRIYAYRDYARCALRLLRKEMRECDLFGRQEAIPNMCLSTDWDTSTHTMYLDGNKYAVDINKMSVVNRYDKHYDLDFKTTGNDEFSDYFEEEDFVACEQCGEWVNEDDCLSIGGYRYCSEDCAREAGCVECAYCGNWHSTDSGGYYAPNGDWYCEEDCLRAAGYYLCENCGAIVSEDECFKIGWHTFCNEDCARSEGWVKCADCGEWFNDLNKNINTGELLCANCAGKRGLKLGWVSEKQYDKKEVKND